MLFPQRTLVSWRLDDPTYYYLWLLCVIEKSRTQRIWHAIKTAVYFMEV